MSSSDQSPVTESALETCLRPFPASEKVFVEGSAPGVKVPMRKITCQPTRDYDGKLIENESVVVYDTSGPYTDPSAAIEVAKGLPALRQDWILGRGDVEELAGATSLYRKLRERDADLDAIRFHAERRPLRAKAGKNVSQMSMPARASSRRRWNSSPSVKTWAWPWPVSRAASRLSLCGMK